MAQVSFVIHYCALSFRGLTSRFCFDLSYHSFGPKQLRVEIEIAKLGTDSVQASIKFSGLILSCFEGSQQARIISTKHMINYSIISYVIF